MLLDNQSAVNCTVSVGRVGFRCCLAAAGAWLDGNTCAFRESHWDPSGSKMTERLTAWQKCLGAEAMGNDTLTDILAASGQICFAAPGSTTTGTFVLQVIFGTVGVFILMIAVAIVGAKMCGPPSKSGMLQVEDSADKPDERKDAADGSADDLETESTSLLTAVNSQRDDRGWDDNEGGDLKKRNQDNV